MAENNRKVVIIGAGIAGLCAAVYARKCGYDVELLEQHDSAGGLAASFRRGDYTFETCLHWLLGSNPKGMLHDQWREVFDIDKLTFVNPEEFVRLETEHGDRLSVFANVDRMEAEFLRVAPQDATEIRRLASAIRRLAKVNLPDPSEPWPGNWLTSLQTLPYLPLLRHFSSITVEEYARRFKHPLLRAFIGGFEPHLSALPLLFSLGWMSEHNGGYPIGGSKAVIRPIVENLNRLGGRVRFGARVKSVLVKDGIASGVQLADGEKISADWVISAADGHATIYNLLGGKYIDKTIDKTYSTLETFSSYLQVSLGIARDLSQQAGYLTRILDAPLPVDPKTSLRQLSFRFFHFDPTFAPSGKTAVTCFLPTHNFEYWLRLQQDGIAQYQAEKHRICKAVIEVLDKIVPNARGAIEVTEVSTPASVIRVTGNWKGSMEGWLITPRNGIKPLPNALPGLRQFLMVGQWVSPGGGLPSGLMTARSAIQSICRQDRVPFTAGNAAKKAAA
jgi:phytoene dehydrogenase-like protein